VILAREETEHGEVALRRREDTEGRPVYEIIFDGAFLMASTNAPSARQLAHLALEPLRERQELHILIGGLGMGYTLQAALEHPEVAHVEVVEIEPTIVNWARAYFGPLNGEALNDKRVRVVVDDLAHHLEDTVGPYDSILLDTDNGPTWLVIESNAALYGRAALERMRALLTPGGVLAVWAAEQAPELAAELGRTFSWADRVVVEETSTARPAEYFIYRAGVPPCPPPGRPAPAE